MNPESFYDKFTKKLITDYLTNNQRMESAIKMVINNISPSSKRILDIGCGIGWSSHEIAAYLPNCQINGVDLSTNSIKVANTLFKVANNSFDKADVTKEAFGHNNQYDAVIMIDVLEHIPQDERTQFIDSINKLMTDKGRFIVSCPTVHHQDYLKEKNPDGLQPVDEDITILVLEDIAKQLNGNIVYFTHTSIWNTNDYLYAVIEKNVEYKPTSISAKNPINLENNSSRVERIRKSEYRGLFDDDEFNRFEVKTSSLKAKIKRFLD